MADSVVKSDLQRKLESVLSSEGSLSCMLQALSMICNDREAMSRAAGCDVDIQLMWSRRSRTIRRAVAEIAAQDAEAEKATALGRRLDELANTDWTALVAALIPEIEDDYRATDDPEDDQPGMCVTVATGDEAESWGYQTGDNSFTGGAYGFPHWAVVYIGRDSEPSQVAAEIAEQLGDLILQ